MLARGVDLRYTTRHVPRLESRENVMAPERSAKKVGLGIVGAGRIGLIRGEIAARNPNVGWIGIAEPRAKLAGQWTARSGPKPGTLSSIPLSRSACQ